MRQNESHSGQAGRNQEQRQTARKESTKGRKARRTSRKESEARRQKTEGFIYFRKPQKIFFQAIFSGEKFFVRFRIIFRQYSSIG